MREIVLDLSTDKCQKIFAGYAGEHNETTITVTLPQRIVSDNYAYVAEFGTPLGNKYVSSALTLTNNTVSVVLTSQTTIQGNVQFQIVASETSGEEVIIRGKTVMAFLVIKPSVDGVDSEYDPQEEASIREELHNDYYNKNDVNSFLGNKLDKAVNRTSTTDTSDIFSATLVTDSGTKALTLKPYTDLGGYVDGVEIGGTVPVRFGNNVSFPSNVPILVTDIINALLWSPNNANSYLGATIPDFIANHRDDATIYFRGYLESPSGGGATLYKLSLSRTEIDGDAAFKTPLIYDAYNGTPYYYIIGENYYYCYEANSYTKSETNAVIASAISAIPAKTVTVTYTDGTTDSFEMLVGGANL